MYCESAIKPLEKRKQKLLMEMEKKNFWHNQKKTQELQQVNQLLYEKFGNLSKLIYEEEGIEKE